MPIRRVHPYSQAKSLIRIGHPIHIKKYISSKDPDFRGLVAEHGRPEDQEKLLKDKNSSVRQLIAENTTSEDHLKKLMKDSNKDVRNAAKENHECNFDYDESLDL